MIGGDVTITILDIRNDTVRIGITAPIAVEVDRGEVREAKDRVRREQDGGLK